MLEKDKIVLSEDPKSYLNQQRFVKGVLRYNVIVTSVLIVIFQQNLIDLKSTKRPTSGIHIVTSGKGPNLHLIANIDYGYMIPDISEEDEEPKRRRKKKRNHKSKVIHLHEIC